MNQAPNRIKPATLTVKKALEILRNVNADSYPISFIQAAGWLGMETIEEAITDFKASKIECAKYIVNQQTLRSSTFIINELVYSHMWLSIEALEEWAGKYVFLDKAFEVKEAIKNAKLLV